MITPNPGPSAITPLANSIRFRRFLGAFGLLLAGATLFADDGGPGLFRGHTDIGTPAQAGTVSHDQATGDYLVGGGGANMWFKSDSFHYAWQQVEGNVAIEADISFPGPGGNAHRKGVLMFRQSLDADAAYVDVAVHGDGLTSLQFREAKGDITHEVQCLAKAPRRVRLEQVGDHVYLSLFSEKGGRQPTGCSARVVFKAPFYVGLGVCAHDDKAFETVRFGRVVIGAPSSEVTRVRSSVEYVKVPSGDRVCVYPSARELAAPAWQADGSLHYTLAHQAYGIRPEANATPQLLSNARGKEAFGVSPDGRWKAFFKRDDAGGAPGTVVLTLQPLPGGEARELMRLPDQERSLLDISWSADSTRIAYVRSQPGPPEPALMEY